MEERNLICIGCPMGCPMTVKLENGKVLEITGNTCRRGKIYAEKEVTNPTRIVTSVVRVKNGAIPMVSVKTREDIPKNRIAACVKALKGVEIPAPVHIGDVILANAADIGVNIIATKNVACEG